MLSLQREVTALQYKKKNYKKLYKIIMKQYSLIIGWVIEINIPLAFKVVLFVPQSS